MGLGWLAAATLALLELAHPAWAIRKPSAGRSYLYHRHCGTADGLGGHVIKVRPYIGIAVHNKWTFVCNPKDWDTAKHHTGNMGFLFGCNSESSVVGALASYESVKDLPWDSMRSPEEAKPNTVYVTKECKSMPPWGESWTWFRSQYQLVRKSDPERLHPKCWPAPAVGEPRRQNVVFAVRKGDDPWRSARAPVYLQILSLLLAGSVPNVPLVSAERAHVVIISETTEEDRDIMQLRESLADRQLPSSFFLGAPEENEIDARDRLVRDLDCMAQADVLVMSISGLSDLAAAVQEPPGVSLFLERKTTRHQGIPNAIHVVTVNRDTQETVEVWPSELPNAMHVGVD